MVMSTGPWRVPPLPKTPKPEPMIDPVPAQSRSTVPGLRDGVLLLS